VTKKVNMNRKQGAEAVGATNFNPERLKHEPQNCTGKAHRRKSRVVALITVTTARAIPVRTRQENQQLRFQRQKTREHKKLIPIIGSIA